MLSLLVLTSALSAVFATAPLLDETISFGFTETTGPYGNENAIIQGRAYLDFSKHVSRIDLTGNDIFGSRFTFWNDALTDGFVYVLELDEDNNLKCSNQPFFPTFDRDVLQVATLAESTEEVNGIVCDVYSLENYGAALSTTIHVQTGTNILVAIAQHFDDEYQTSYHLTAYDYTTALPQRANLFTLPSICTPLMDAAYTMGIVESIVQEGQTGIVQGQVYMDYFENRQRVDITSAGFLASRYSLYSEEQTITAAYNELNEPQCIVENYTFPILPRDILVLSVKAAETVEKNGKTCDQYSITNFGNFDSIDFFVQTGTNIPAHIDMAIFGMGLHIDVTSYASSQAGAHSAYFVPPSIICP